MVTKVLMYIHTEKQKERVKLHEPYIQLAPNTQKLIIHPHRLPVTQPKDPLITHLTQSPSFSPLPNGLEEITLLKDPTPYHPL